MAASSLTLPLFNVFHLTVCVLYTQGIANREWREFGRTEVIDNTLNPDFVRKFILDYFFEERQNLRFDLYDLDCKSDNLSKHVSVSFCSSAAQQSAPHP
ncbi:copine-8-like [Cynoglossus semilaevis]|uniref:copine-8-like n=1 Tax=Cynoglossus semilaevis TaxID=244447 RepID=UPI000D628E72|nr:copine-8-like [Cynoglossus semilaevis]